MSDTRNVKLGVCSVVYDGVDLGYTKGGVEVEVQSGTKEVEVDQFGNSPINEYILSRSVMAKVPMAETTLENLIQIMPGATLEQTGGVKATGTVTFSGLPAADDTVTINGVVFTYKVAAAGAREVTIGADATAAAANLVAKLNLSSDLAVVAGTYTSALGVMTVTYDTLGDEGNAFTLAKSGTNIAVSGATLTGGVDGSGAVVRVTNGIGISLLDYARKLVLHPIGNAADDRSGDFTIPLAATAGAIQFAYKLDEERIFPVMFKGYPNPVNRDLFLVGDHSVLSS